MAYRAGMARLWSNGCWEIRTGLTGLTVWRHSTVSRPARWVMEFPTDRPDASLAEVADFLAARGVDAAEFLTPDAVAAVADQPTRAG